MTRLYMVGSLLFARLPGSILTLFDVRDRTAFGNLLLQKLKGVPGWGSKTDSGPQPIDSLAQELKKNLDPTARETDDKANLLQALRSAFGFGRAQVEPPINSAFLGLFREFVDLSNDDRNNIDPRKIAPERGTIIDPRYPEQVRAFLRDYKRSIIRLVTNMSVAGTIGTKNLTEKWAGIMKRCMEVLADVATCGNVISTDNDDRYPWSVLAAITGQERETVKKYVVQGFKGTELLRDAIKIYDAMKSDNLLSQEDFDDNLLNIFFIKGSVFTAFTVPEKVLQSASIVRDNWIGDWNLEV